MSPEPKAFEHFFPMPEAALNESIGCSSQARVFFEEWDEPLISGIGWVSELIGIAGGEEIFPELSTGRSAKDRIVTTEQVIERRPDIIIGSWCGKRFVPARVRERPGFASIPAVARGELYEIKSTLILQPGPAALTDGLDAVQAIIEGWSRRAAEVR